MTTILIDRATGLASSAAIKAPCYVATTANITLAGLQTIDGTAVTADKRVLVKDQTDATQNGIYIAATGDWERAPDFYSNDSVREGTRVFVTDGATNLRQEFTVTTSDPISIGTSSITIINSTTVQSATSIAAAIVAAGAKATPVDADKFGFWDSVSGLFKSTTWANIKATLLAYFSTLFLTLAAQVLTAAQQGQARANIGADLLPGFRNKIINGDFDIWQRGTSFANPASGAFTADRWGVEYDGAGATRTISRQNHALGQTDVPGNPTYFLRWAQTVAGSGGTYNNLFQKVEGVRTLAGKAISVVVYMKASTAISVLVQARQTFGTGGAPSLVVGVSDSTSLIGTVWTRVAIPLSMPSISGKTLGSNGDDSFGLFFNLPANAALTLDVSHVAVVEESATAEADPFSPRHIEQELALCERYYEKSFTLATAPAQNVGSPSGEFIWPATNTGATSAISPSVVFRQRKRATPTMTLYNPSAANAQIRNETDGADFSGSSASAITDNGFYFAGTGSAGTAVGERLGVHWTADAEL